MITEAEAKTKWCPLARTPIDAPDGLITGFIPANRSERGLPASCLCIGSACMAWRWIESHPASRLQYAYGSDGNHLQRGAAEPPRPPSIPESWEWQPGDPDALETTQPRWRETGAEALLRRQGYCGAFGRTA